MLQKFIHHRKDKELNMEKLEAIGCSLESKKHTFQSKTTFGILIITLPL